MVQDADKVSKVLVNLANMCEMQVRAQWCTPCAPRVCANMCEMQVRVRARVLALCWAPACARCRCACACVRAVMCE